jgi:hypothetical protein
VFLLDWIVLDWSHYALLEEVLDWYFPLHGCSILYFNLFTIYANQYFRYMWVVEVLKRQVPLSKMITSIHRACQICGSRSKITLKRQMNQNSDAIYVWSIFVFFFIRWVIYFLENDLHWFCVKCIFNDMRTERQLGWLALPDGRLPARVRFLRGSNFLVSHPKKNPPRCARNLLCTEPGDCIGNGAPLATLAYLS